MILTLYKNCILNDNYNEVFDLTKKTRVIDGITESYSVFTDYLKGLNKNVINLPNVYYSRNMSFTLGISGENKAKEAFEYNYCKIEAEGIVRYCFITDIELANSVATYYTEEDIWSNYAYDMQFRYGYLTNALRTRYKKVDNDGNITYKDIKYYTLPVGFQSNNLPKYNRVATSDGLYNIVLQIQLYNLTTGGEANKRVVRTALLSNVNIDSSGNITISASKYNTEEVNKILSLIQSDTSSGVITRGNDIKDIFPNDETLHYQIDNITILPYEWGLGNIIETTSITDLSQKAIGISVFSLITSIMYINFPAIFYTTGYSYPDLKTIITGELANDFKVISFGTRTGQYEVNMNGTSLPYALKISSDDTNFKLLLEFQNKCIDITNDFVFDIPFTALTADTTAQRRIAKNTAIYNGVANIIGGTAQVALNIGGIAKGNIVSTEVYNKDIQYEVSKRGKYNRIGETSEKTKSISPQKAGTFGGVIGGVKSIADGIVGIVNANTPQYTTNTGTFVSSEAFLNARFGLCYLSIEPDNAEYVQNMRNLIGYNVFEVIYDDIIFNQDFLFDNVLKFETVNIYGSFPLSIKEALKSILINGFRIYYNKNAYIQ